MSTYSFLAIYEIILFPVEQSSAPVIPTSGIIKGQLMKSELTYHFRSYPLCRRLSRLYVKFNNSGKNAEKPEFNSVNDTLSY